MFDNNLKDMLREMRFAPKEILPSKYWEELNKKNFAQLQQYGFNNFKRTIGLNYFTWLPIPIDSQIRYLLKNLPIKTTIPILFQTISSSSNPPLSRIQTWSYVLITRLLWEYALRNDLKKELYLLDEPKVGNPPDIRIKNKIISQDLANSFLEYNAIFDSKKMDPSKIKTIIELGSGYGRTAYVFLKLMPHAKYILVDIPPALYIAQKYFSKIFPRKKIFKFQSFKSFENVAKEFKEAQIIFILPHQLNLLPQNYADLFINISSLHEMRPEQITYYFKLIKRLTHYYFYFKQWKISKIPYDKIIIRENDYPIPRNWRQIYWRQCKVQSRFFEALFQVKSTRGK